MICRKVVYGEKEGRREEWSLVVSKLALYSRPEGAQEDSERSVSVS